MASSDENIFNVPAFLACAGVAAHVVAYRRHAVIVTQGDACSHVFYLQEGGVKLSVASRSGREAIVAMLQPGQFFGEGCLTGQARHHATATATAPCRVLLVAKDQMLRVLHTQHALSSRFIAHLLARNIRIEEDLLDQLFNSAEKRLARALLLLARYDASEPTGADDPPGTIGPITQEALADMIGTTRSRVNGFMKKFERLGFIDARDGLKVHPSLRTVVASD